jgi:hypothetical protein
MRLRELFEAAAPSVGRKYQHIEDLVFTNGSTGGLHAIERLRHMTQVGGNIELKWDGSPVVYWGKDEQGRFSLIPKNAWEYLKRGKTETADGTSTVMNSAEDVRNFILKTGKVKPGEEKQRQNYAKKMADLWHYFSDASPPNGYIEGGILFSPEKPAVLNPKTKEYDFTPNITSFHIPKDSELGKRIGKSKVMVAATGWYPTLGSSDEQRFPDAEQLSTGTVIVQGTTYVENPPQVDSRGLDYAEQFIQQHAAEIDGFLQGQPGLTKPGDVLYKFFNQNLRVAGVKQKFVDWCTQNLSAGQAQKVIRDPRINVILDAVEMLTNEKMKIIGELSQGTHGNIRQTKPEGYVQAHPGTQFRNDLPGQFVKAIDQANWAPRKD